MNALALSVVIPALDEAACIGALLGDLRGLRVAHEVIVVDGGSSDDTVERARQGGAVVLRSARGRGRQLREGGAAARAPMLCFLHADSRLPPDTLRALEALALGDVRGAWAFRLRIDAPGASYRIVEHGAHLRSRVAALPYGDQGLVLDRATYDAVGGYADVPLMEDVVIARALRAVGGVQLRRESVIASARRWERDGVVRRTLANVVLLLRFLLGASPHDLARHYTAHTPRNDPR